MGCYATRAGFQSSLVDCNICKGGPWSSSAFKCAKAVDIAESAKAIAEKAVRKAAMVGATSYYWQSAGGSYTMRLERLVFITPDECYVTSIVLDAIKDRHEQYEIKLALREAKIYRNI